MNPLVTHCPWGTMRRTTIAAITAAGLLATLTACSSEPDVRACETAMQKQYADAIKAGDKAKEGSRPAACEGVDSKTLERIAGEIVEQELGAAVDKELGKATESATPEPTASATISPECRAWIESELQSQSDDIDAAAGQKACGDLSDEELNQAIDDVTNELTGQNP